MALYVGEQKIDFYFCQEQQQQRGHVRSIVNDRGERVAKTDQGYLDLFIACVT